MASAIQGDFVVTRHHIKPQDFQLLHLVNCLLVVIHLWKHPNNGTGLDASLQVACAASELNPGIGLVRMRRRLHCRLHCNCTCKIPSQMCL